MMDLIILLTEKKDTHKNLVVYDVHKDIFNRKVEIGSFNI